MVLLHTRVGTVAATLFAALLVWHLRGTVADALLLPWLGAKLAVAVASLVGLPASLSTMPGVSGCGSPSTQSVFQPSVRASFS